MFGINSCGVLNVPSKTFTGGTPGMQIIPPYGGSSLQRVVSGVRYAPEVHTVVSTVCYTTGATAHVIGIMRPFNWTYIATANAANSTTLVLYDDPGAYSTNWKWSNPNSKPANVANNAIAANDWVAFQLVDGSWHVSKVASLSSLTLTLSTATPNVTGGGASVGTPVYFFGVIGDTDPNTTLVNPQCTIAANATASTVWSDQNGILQTMHTGTPMLFYSPASTNDGTLEHMSGFYYKLQ